jgi:hypothetical protein
MKRIAIAVAVAVIAAAGIAAQVQSPATTAQGGADARLFSLELGLPVGYRLSDGALVSGRAFGLNIAVSDSFLVGIASTQVGSALPLTAYNTLRLSYTIMPLLGASVFIGQAGTATSAGLGLYSTIFQARNSAGLGTGLRLRVDYLFDITAISGGSAVFTTSILFGI